MIHYRPNIDENGVYTTAQVAEILDIHKITLYRWMKKKTKNPLIFKRDEYTGDYIFRGRDIIEWWNRRAS